MSSFPQHDSTPFVAAPPGLENASGDLKACLLKGVEERLQQLGAGASTGEIKKTILESILSEVDARLSEKTAEMWRRGQQSIMRMEEKHKEKLSALTEEVRKTVERQQLLEEENEKLRQVIGSLQSRFALLGAVFGGKGGTQCTTPRTASPPTGASPTPHQITESPPHSSPVPQTTTQGDSGLPATNEAPSEAKPLPPIPDFPLGSPVQTGNTGGPPNAAITPLSLADALDSQTQQRTQLSLMQSLSPAPAEVAPVPLPVQFSFTIRKADGADLGLNVSHHAEDQVLQVEGVRPEGAVESWNRQCLTGYWKDKQVCPGDRIIQVNDVAFDPVKMLEECRDKTLLKLTISRGGHTPTPFAQLGASPAATTAATTDGAPAKPSSVLRAEASEFVPSQPLSSLMTQAPTEKTAGASVPPTKASKEWKEGDRSSDAQDTDTAQGM